MNLFICEHASQALPSSGEHSSAGFRSEILLRALLSDVALVADLQVTILSTGGGRMAGLPNDAAGVTVVSIEDGDRAAIVDSCMKSADVVWPLAPESNGLLEAISKDVQRHAKILLGSSPDAVHLTGSKYRTAQALQAVDIDVVPTYRAHTQFPADHGAWVVKPDDGAGCSDTHIFLTLSAAREWILARHGNYVLQPYLYGRPLSLTLLCGVDDVFLLGCNDQHIAVSDNQFHYMGSTVNSMEDSNGHLARLARRVVAAIPGVWGYVGIDLIMTDKGPVVLEVNPRVTMSHGGLHASLGVNPAQMLFDVLHHGHCDTRPLYRNRQISVDINSGPFAQFR